MYRRGFTLIELLVVIVILAVLMAIAIPTLLNQRNKARDTDAKSDITNAYRAMKAEYTEDERYTTSDRTAAASAEPQLAIGAPVANSPFVNAATSETQVRIHVASTDGIVVTRRSKSGINFALVSVERSGVDHDWNNDGDVVDPNSGANDPLTNTGFLPEPNTEVGVTKGKSSTSGGHISRMLENGWN